MKWLKNMARRLGLTRQPLVGLANIAEGTHEDGITKLADAAITTRFLLVKFGTDADHIAVNGASDRPLGVCEDEPAAAEAPAHVAFLGQANRTRKVVASEIIAYGAEVFTAASGKVQDEPAVAGTYYLVGDAIQAAGADGDVIEIVPCKPMKFVVS